MRLTLARLGRQACTKETGGLDLSVKGEKRCSRERARGGKKDARKVKKDSVDQTVSLVRRKQKEERETADEGNEVRRWERGSLGDWD